jgi:hypothetical protein
MGRFYNIAQSGYLFVGRLHPRTLIVNEHSSHCIISKNWNTKEIKMLAKIKARTSLYFLPVLLVITLLSGIAPMNHSPAFALAQFPDDAFGLSKAAELANLTIAPTANFSADPTGGGPPPLQVQFADQSTGNPTGWAWYFGDEAFDEPWTQMTDAAEWTKRSSHSSVALPDGSIVLMGGSYLDLKHLYLNDVWRSTDQGATWTQMTAAARVGDKE